MRSACSDRKIWRASCRRAFTFSNTWVLNGLYVDLRASGARLGTARRVLTTAAIVWLTAAIGMACGAGLPILALAVTGGHFVVVFAFPYIAGRLPRSRWTPSLLQICYHDGRDVLREVLLKCTQHNFAVSRLHVEKEPPAGAATADRTITVALEVQGTGPVSKLTSKLAGIDGVVSVNAGDVNVVTE